MDQPARRRALGPPDRRVARSASIPAFTSRSAEAAPKLAGNTAQQAEASCSSAVRSPQDQAMA